MNQKILFIRIISVLLLGVLILFFLNGMTTHPIKEMELEQTFLDSVAENGLTQGEIVKKETYGNSVTFLFSDGKDGLACATYGKSLYSRNWRELKFYTSKMSVFNQGEVSYNINDKLAIYSVTCHITDNPSVTFSENQSLVLSVKTFGICVILMAGFAGRLMGAKFRRK